MAKNDPATALTPLLSSIGLRGREWWVVGFGDVLVDLACEEPFEAADDVFFGEAFCGAAGDVVDGGLVESHADDGYSVEGCVGLAVSASVEAVPAGLS